MARSNAGRPVITLTEDVANMSAEELEARLAELKAQVATLRKVMRPAGGVSVRSQFSETERHIISLARTASGHAIAAERSQALANTASSELNEAIARWEAEHQKAWTNSKAAVKVEAFMGRNAENTPKRTRKRKEAAE